MDTNTICPTAQLICFLNWGDLQMYNFTRRPETLRSNLKSLFYDQGISHMVMSLKVTAMEEPGPDDSPDLPVVHFTGFARHLYHPNDPDISSDIQGSCCPSALNTVDFMILILLSLTQELADSQRRARFAGRPSPPSTATPDGRPNASRLAASERRVRSSEIGSLRTSLPPFFSCFFPPRHLPNLRVLHL